MAEFPLAPPSTALLADVVLEPGPVGEHKGLEDEPLLRTVLGKQNRVQIGVPQTTDVLGHWPDAERLQPEIARTRSAFDFYCVRLAFTFLPDSGCRFLWARIIASLTADEADTSSMEIPTVVDMFPREVIADVRTFRRSFEISPAMKLGLAELQVTGGIDNEVVRYDPRLTPGGLLTDAPNWTFEPGERAGISGSTELLVLVKKARNHILHARFLVAAEVGTYAGRIALRKYKNPSLANQSFILQPGN